MDEVGLLLGAYREQLYDRLVESRGLLAERIESVLKSEIAKRVFSGFDERKYAAYREAEPGLQKLPDYAVARAIEEIIY